MAEELASGVRRFLDGVSSPDRERALSVLAACPTVELDRAAPGFRAAFPTAALVLVVDGFVVSRVRVADGRRSVVTCQGGAGEVLLPPSAAEELCALGTARLCVIDTDARASLLQAPALAGRIVEQLALSLAHKQEATAHFGLIRHVERVRRKLLELARSYGHVVADGVRIDFPVSHALLGEMIGSSRETVTRAVDELQRAGFVARRGSTYRLLVSPESVSEPSRT
jgi:CRP-like cAMP-binding protein